MHEEEFRDSRECADCGTPTNNGSPSFEFSEDIVLCFDCALRRGGQYDTEQDTWVVQPDLAGIPDERRPHL
jgi:hypothetical protein